MACLELPATPFPTLPGGLTLGAAMPGTVLDPALCCKLLPFPVVVPPVALGVSLSPVIVAALNTALTALNAYMDALPIKCPIEP